MKESTTAPTTTPSPSSQSLDLAEENEADARFQRIVRTANAKSMRSLKETVDRLEREGKIPPRKQEGQ